MPEHPSVPFQDDGRGLIASLDEFPLAAGELYLIVFSTELPSNLAALVAAGGGIKVVPPSQRGEPDAVGLRLAHESLAPRLLGAPEGALCFRIADDPGSSVMERVRNERAAALVVIPGFKLDGLKFSLHVFEVGIPSAVTAVKGSDDLDARLRRIEEAEQAAGFSELDASLPEKAAETAIEVSVQGYQLIRPIARGGQGVVFEAAQKSTGRRVAVKVIHGGGFIGPRDRARFEREVQILAALNHPNIVQVMDRGVTADGSLYLVMPFIAGRPLDQVINASPGDSTSWLRGEQADLLRLFLKIADAVNAAHLRGVVHRDLKPSNIRVDERGEPHVLDFGLARAGLAGEGEGLTITGQFMGSLPWASPEQAEGDHTKIDTRTDVYALGVILYQMVTGQFPYEVVGTMPTVVANIMHRPPTPPSTALSQRGASGLQGSRRSHHGKVRRRAKGPSIDPTLEAIILKSLAKAREERYQSAGDLARDLANYLSDRPTAAGGAHESRWWPTGIVATAALLLTLAVALTAGAGWWLESRNASTPRVTGIVIPHPNGNTATHGPAARAAIAAVVARIKELEGVVISDPTRKDGIADIIFEDKDVTDDDLAAIATLPSVHTLTLTRCDMITDIGLSHVARIQGLTSLVVIGDTITDRGLQHLVNIGQLKTLSINSGQVTNDGLVVLEHLTQLSYLRIEGRQLTGGCFIHVRGLTNLWFFQAELTLIHDDDLKHLEHLTGMYGLILRSAGIGDGGVKYLAGMKELENLNIELTQITGAGLKHLPASKLHHLNLVRCPKIGDADLAALERFSNLRDLNLAYTSATDAGIAALRKKLPNTIITGGSS